MLLLLLLLLLPSSSFLSLTSLKHLLTLVRRKVGLDILFQMKISNFLVLRILEKKLHVSCLHPSNEIKTYLFDVRVTSIDFKVYMGHYQKMDGYVSLIILSILDFYSVVFSLSVLK